MIIDKQAQLEELGRLRAAMLGCPTSLIDAAAWATQEPAQALREALKRLVALESELKRIEAKPKLDERKALAFDDLVRCAEHSAVGLVEFQFAKGKFSVKCVLADGDELEAPESNTPEQACHNGYEELRDWYGKREGGY